jgi:EmrB/QacA subfamily drug resistance transporter
MPLSEMHFSTRRLVLATLGTMMALLLAALDQTIVGTAMPRIVTELKGLDYYAWVTTAYLVTSTVVVPVAGKLGDMFGRKPFLLAGMVGFVAASALCGLSQDMLMLVLFRGLQGIFGGVLFASVFTVIGDLYPPERRARIQGVFGAVFGLSAVIGPTVGGYLTDNLSWRWVFYVNVPVGVLAVALVATALPFVRSKATWRDIDFLGSFLLAAGMVPLLVALSITRDHSWGSWQVLSLLGVAVVMLVAFFFEERRAEHPVVPFHLFRNRTYAVAMITAFLTAFGMFGTIIFVPLDFQGVLGVSVQNSGLLITPMMVGMLTASTLTGLIMTRIRYYRYLGTLGVLLMIGGMYLLAQVTVGSSQLEVSRDIIIIGAGLGVSFPLYINAVQAALPRQFLGVATSQIQFWRNVGGTVSTAVMGSILARIMPGKISDQVNALHLPPQVAGQLGSFGGGSSPQALFDPAKLAATRAALPPQFRPVFDQILGAVKLGLANTLHDIYLIAAAILVLALIATLFLKEVPLRRSRGMQVLEEAAEGSAPVELQAAG